MSTQPLSLEQEVKQLLGKQKIRYRDHTRAFEQLDFEIWLRPPDRFFLEVKEKRQIYQLENWPAFVPEEHLFIIDELTVRKCLAYSPRCGVLVRDNLLGRYHFFSMVSLLVMPRLRVNRPIERNRPELKGKWLVDLRSATQASSLADALTQIHSYLDEMTTLLFDLHPCYGDYPGEEIQQAGVVRTPAHWEIDVKATR